MVSALKNVEQIKYIIALPWPATASKVWVLSMEYAQFAQLVLSLLLVVPVARSVVSTSNLLVASASAILDMPLIQPKSAQPAPLFQMVSLSTDTAQSVLLPWSTTESAAVYAPQVKLYKVPSVQVYVRVMSCWMLMETVTVVVPIRLFPMVSASALLDILRIVVEFVR